MKADTRDPTLCRAFVKKAKGILANYPGIGEMLPLPREEQR